MIVDMYAVLFIEKKYRAVIWATVTLGEMDLNELPSFGDLPWECGINSDLTYVGVDEASYTEAYEVFQEEYCVLSLVLQNNWGKSIYNALELLVDLTDVITSLFEKVVNFRKNAALVLGCSMMTELSIELVGYWLAAYSSCTIERDYFYTCYCSGF